MKCPAACLCILGLSPALAATKPFDVDVLMRIRQVGAPVMSPAGDRVVYTVRQTDLESDRKHHDLWLSEVRGGEPLRLTTHEADEVDPAWSPDGRTVWFLSDRGGTAQVWRIPVDGGEAIQVTDLPLDVGTFRLAPTGDRLVVSLAVYPDCADLECTTARNTERDESKVSARRYDQLFMRHWSAWLDERRSQLFAVALDEDGMPSGAPVNLSRMDADVPSRPFGGSEEYAVAPDGRTLYFSARRRDRDEPLSTNFDIYAVAMDGSGEPRNLTADNPAWDTQPLVTPDGRALVYLAMSRASYESDRRRVMWREIGSGETRELAPGWDYSPYRVSLTPDGRALLARTPDRGQEALWRLPLGRGRPERLIGSGSVTGMATNGRQLVYTYDDLGSPSEVYVADAGGRKARRLTHFNDAALADVGLGAHEQFSFTGGGGDTVSGYLVKPVALRPDRKYPVALLIHGGPQQHYANGFYSVWNPQVWAGEDIAVVLIDFHGTLGYGQAFTDSVSGDWGGKPVEDLRLGLAAVLERYPFLDGERVCALGGSYGGFMVNWLAGQWPDRFRCFVNHAGIFDQRSMYYSTEELWFPEWEFGGPYHARPESYERFNPALFVNRWQTPMLVIHNELDYRVPLAQGIATFTALQRRGIDSRFITFPDEGHGVSLPNNQVYWHAQVSDWLHRYLD